ncbi:MAG: mandelate racemase/muconate lactonizing enzyme family protein [Bryobacteraceae bacterium]|nr:mandelate racemase/muconate lactonizing enzyme family protein [Bryobacteraceae bacterium]
MRISEIKTFALKAPLGEERFWSSQCPFPERKSLLVRIATDDGVVGWGEGGQYGPAEPVAACIDAVLAPRILGQDPRERWKIWEQLYAFSRDFGRNGVYVDAISGIDIALWDITGKVLGEPVFRLLGGPFRTSVEAYATGCYYRGHDPLDVAASLEAVAAEARSYREAGFRILKTKIGLLPVEQDLERIAAVRAAAGSDCVILADANHAYNVPTAIRAGRGLERLDVRWFEEPVTPEDREGYRQVRRSLSIPIAGGECEFTRFGFRDLFTGGCVDIAQPDICAAGGISEWQKIHALADSFGVWVIPHVWGSGVALAAALHALAATPPFPHTANPVPLQNEPVIEYDRNPNPLRDELLKERITVSAGRLPVPQGPGLGIEVDEAVLSRCLPSATSPST